jgi:hypothetical protein
MKTDGLEPIRQAIRERRRPETAGIEELTSMWKKVVDRRRAHLELARQHFSLEREDVERSVRG